MKTSNPLLRRKTTPNKPIFYMATSKDVVSGLNVDAVISGTRYRVNPDTGLIESVAPNVPAVESNGLRMCPAFTQYFLNNQTPVTQSITLPAGIYCLWIEGSGSSSYNGNTATAGNPIVFTLASSTTANCTITGSVTRVMLNSGFFIAPFTPTSGTPVAVVAEVATAATGMSFDLDDVKLTNLKKALRGPNGQGHLEIYWTPGFDPVWLPVGRIINLLSTNNHNTSKSPAYVSILASGGLKFEASDGIGYPNVTVQTPSMGATHKIIVDWGYLNGVMKMRLKVNGIASSIASFSGSFGDKDLSFGYANTANSWVKNMKFLPTPLW